MKKAQNIIEIALLACLVVIIAIATMTIYNNQKLSLAKKSEVNVKGVNLTTMTTTKASETVQYNKVETAGTNALEKLGMTSSTFESALSKLTYEDLANAINDSDSQDLADLANQLISSLKLDYSQIEGTSVTSNTVSDLIGILNVAASSTNYSDTSSAEYLYVQRFKALLEAASS